MNIERRASLRKTINSLNLSEAEEVLKSKYKYTPGKPGRPPLPPIGMFLSFTIMFLRMESYRDHHAFLEKHSFWRRILGFKQTPDISNFTHFLQRIGTDTFEQLFQVVVQQLLDEGFLNLHTIAQDGSILEGNLNDKEAGWGWDHIDKKYIFGYKIHTIVDTKTELPVTLSITKANVHDSKEFKSLYPKIKDYKTRFSTKFYIGDKAFDTYNIRTTLLTDEVTPIIKASKTRIEPQYPKWFLEKYKERVAVERFFSRLKRYLDLKKLGIYGKKNVILYTYFICIGMLLVGYLNHQLGHSPRSIKTFIRTYT